MKQKSFVLLPRRWVVGRTFAWRHGHRRLSKDYEVLPKNSEALYGKLSSSILRYA
jgi:putative transposase